MKPNERTKIIGYLGHDPELFNDTIENNILMGEKKDAGTFLKMVCMEKEVAAMDDAEQSLIGSRPQPSSALSLFSQTHTA